MAGEWIKVEASTADKPEVLRIARILAIPHDAVFGKLVRLWAWIDTNSVDGVVDGVVDADIDRICRCDGFTAACVTVGWLEYDASMERVSLPNFERHNGETAKQRAMKNRRQAKWRAGVDDPVDAAASTEASTREEKRREEQKQEQKALVQPTAARSPFLDFWAAYPNKKGKQEAEKTWERRKLDSRCAELIAHVRLMAATDSDWRRGYVPMGSTYLNQARWEDVPKRPPDSGPVAQSKTLTAIQTLEDMKHGLAGYGTSDGFPETALLGVGSHPGD